jgi:hypothetical protein
MNEFKNVSPPLSKETIAAFNNWVRPVVNVRSCLNCKYGVRQGENFDSMFWEFNEPDLNEIECQKNVDRFQNGQEICDARGIEKYNAKAKLCDVYENRSDEIEIRAFR